MLELIGSCVLCGKEIYCRTGFLEGVYTNGKLFCFDCAKKEPETRPDIFRKDK